MEKEKLLQEARSHFYHEYGVLPENDGYECTHVYDDGMTVVFAPGMAEIEAFCRSRKNKHRVDIISLIAIALLPIYMLVCIRQAVDLMGIVKIFLMAIAVSVVCLVMQLFNAYRNRKLKKIYHNKIIVYFRPNYRSGFYTK